MNFCILQIFILVLMFRCRIWRDIRFIWVTIHFSLDAKFGEFCTAAVLADDFSSFLIIIIVVVVVVECVALRCAYVDMNANVFTMYKMSFSFFAKMTDAFDALNVKCVQIYQKCTTSTREREKGRVRMRITRQVYDTIYGRPYNKICWNKINFIESNAKCIPNDLRAVAVNLAELWDSVIAFVFMNCCRNADVCRVEHERFEMTKIVCFWLDCS